MGTKRQQVGLLADAVEVINESLTENNVKEWLEEKLLVAGVCTREMDINGQMLEVETVKVNVTSFRAALTSDENVLTMLLEHKLITSQKFNTLVWKHLFASDVQLKG